MEEEMSLREIIEIILNGRKLIIGITLAALLIAAVVTFFPSTSPPTPMYRAQAKIRIEQLSQESFTPSTGGYFSTLITALMNAERYNAEAFAELIKHPDLLAGVREKLQLDERGIASGFLTKDLEVEMDANKTELTIALTHTDPEFALNVVNTVSDEFREFLANRQRERIDLVASNLERLIALELQGLNSTLQRLEETRTNYNPLITYRDTSHVTPEYNVLSNDIARTISQIAQLEAQQEEIRNFRLQVAMVLRSVDDWVIFTPATQATDVTPDQEPRWLLNIAIAGILGLMSSIFIVFFLNYWKETSPTSVAK
ncbi:MAG: Wzz/FepE/Etk N-terminal domain-containing protein [Bacillota bacterium]|nr:Wzz/FepE/Etk N-terminal domain-containing protein [Bacillota bacterium]